MRPIRAQSDRHQGPHAPARGRHRKPHPRKVLLAAGGLAIAAGVLSLVRAAPDSGVGAPGTAEAEPRLDPTAATTALATPADHHARPTTPSSDPSVLRAGPTPSGALTPTPATPAATPTTLPGGTGAPTPARTFAPRPTATAAPPAHTPAPTHTPAPPAPLPTPSPTATRSSSPGGGEACVPVIGLCVDLPDLPRR
ncbi:hypothetical protein [Streptomyces collinus]|uniref:Uncharacterized protein n=1 Tax=Streptomyces collinus (strain DSM 40733 / Tue 365) TaxID=1214242 RepID=S5VLK7_STRC3|nr:hypothetical protein [Streptomyces collinus]AGS71437.1 hypothetical protein B446_23125 [Streptomyces collinus Tu 365]UJA10085.1 hypothetical protein HGI10_40470 [Streptomyces collinus]UJA15051.1 hypothetical protein HGI09_23650 [Streptomyces collinus]